MASVVVVFMYSNCMQKGISVLNVFCLTMCDRMKHVCLAQILILFKGFTSNKNNLYPVLSQHITGDDKSETADVPAVEPLCSPLVEVFIVRKWCREWMIIVGSSAWKVSLVFLLLRSANMDYLVWSHLPPCPLWVNISGKIKCSSGSMRTVCGICLCAFVCYADCTMTVFPAFTHSCALPCGYTCSNRPQVIATFVGWSSKCEVGMGAASEWFYLVCPLCWEGGGESFGLLSLLHTASYISPGLILYQQKNRYVPTIIVWSLFIVMIDRVVVCACFDCFCSEKEAFLCCWVCQYKQSIFSCWEQ